jgi:hypothetical protein
MRRVWASLLVAVFSFSLTIPLLSDDASLAACCRRNGQHHCAMMAMHPSSAPSDTPKALAARCPNFQKVGLVSAASRLWTPDASRAFFAAVVSHPAVHPQIEARQRVSLARSCQKRGPPVFLS